jgi:CDP-glucose 4,6-dehydratase
VDMVIGIWGEGGVEVRQDPGGKPEANLLQLNCDRAWNYLKWRPTWAYEKSVQHTTLWYKKYQSGADVQSLTMSQIENYMREWETGDE